MYMSLFKEQMYTLDEAVFHCSELLSSLAQHTSIMREPKNNIPLTQHQPLKFFLKSKITDLCTEIF